MKNSYGTCVVFDQSKIHLGNGISEETDGNLYIFDTFGDASQEWEEAQIRYDVKKN